MQRSVPERFRLQGSRLGRTIDARDGLRHARRCLARIERVLLSTMARVVDYSAAAPNASPQIGMSPTACLTRIRIEHAARLDTVQPALG